MTRLLAYINFVLLFFVSTAQTENKRSPIEEQYFSEQGAFAGPIGGYIYSDFPSFNSMTEADFVNEIDSLKAIFDSHLSNYSDKLEQSVIDKDKVGIKYFFDKLLLDYPANHETYTGKSIVLSIKNQSRLDNNQNDLNVANLLSIREFRDYVQALLDHQVNKELEKDQYRNMDNQSLNARWNSIKLLFHNQEMKDFWRNEYLSNHIDNIGIKNIDDLYEEFLVTCENSDYTDRIRQAYGEQKKGRQGHLIETYKEVDDFKLDMHIFLPDTSKFKGSRPVMVDFHGGSWSVGNLNWFFSSGEYYASQGWVAVGVEYRIGERHGTLPFEAVKDAKSAIRWLRENAKQYQIDPSRIVASGNSAGGHLVLSTALANKWNEETDNLAVSSVPDVLMINSGAYDLTIDNTKWITKDLDNKNIVKEISPNHLMNGSLPPTLIIHGSNDRNCPYPTAEFFVNEMSALGNDINFQTIEGAGHYIWFGRYGGEVSKIRKEFLEMLGY